MKPGDRLPDLERLIDLGALVAYAAATWDWYAPHYDPAAATANRLPAPLADGQMFGALLAEQALDWAPAMSQVRKMGFRFKAMVFAGESVLCHGTVEEVDGRRVRVSQSVTCGGRVVLDSAYTELELPE